MKVIMRPTIDLEEVCDEMKLHLSDFEFTQMAENGSYVSVDLTEEAIEELKEDIEWEIGKSKSRCKRLQNQLNFVLMLREMGYTDNILVFVFW